MAAPAAAPTAEELRRSNNIMERPKEGWLHDDAALTAGDEGIFYSFPVFFAGSIQLKESLRSLDMQEQTDLTRELIAVVAEKAGVRNAADRPANEALKRKFFKFLSSPITVGQVEVSLCISSSALAIGPPQELMKSAGVSLNGFLAMHDMKTVSLAAGGELRDYDLVAYVAKDSVGNRECYVFDCGGLADEVLTTMGQAFVLAQQVEARAKKAMLDQLYKDTGAAGADKKKALVEGLNKRDSVRRSVRPKAMPKKAIRHIAKKELSPSELEELRLRDTGLLDKERPGWVQADVKNKISLDELRRQWAEKAQTEEVIEIEEED